MASRDLKGISILALASTMSLIACTPLQQAPLVYSSKVVVGVDISSPTAEQPGATVNIGYKLVDIAYVPVAVAKPCEKLDENNPQVSVDGCSNDIYKIHPISGSSTKDNQISSNQNADEALRLKKEIADLNAEVTKLKADVQQKREEAERVKTAGEVANKKIDSENDKSLPNRSTVASLQTQSLNLAAELLKSESEIVDKQKIVDLKVAELEKKKSDLSKLENRQDDSYSVFGSFDSATTSNVNANEKNLNANVALGKVFSTGIAAQNLTKGLGDQFSSSSLNTCILSAQKMIKDYENTVKPTSPEQKEAYSKFSELAISVCIVKRE